MYVTNGSVQIKSSVRVVDLRCDTVCKPSPQMRKAIFEAEVGDDGFGEDPTVAALERKVADMLGKETGLFVATATMGNYLAIMCHCHRRGSEMVVGNRSHIFLKEQGGPAQLSGIHTRAIPNNADGTFDIAELEKSIRLNNPNYPKTALVCVENTHNSCGGRALPLDWLDELGLHAKWLHLPIHMDGARLFNAAVHMKVPPSRLVRDCSSVVVCLNKGLGAPVGAVLVGSADFIKRARTLRKVMGGAMTQSGYLAAAGIYALDNMVDRLEEDHERIATIGKAIVDMNSKVIRVDAENLHTNILMIRLDSNVVTSRQFERRLLAVTEKEVAQLGDGIAAVKMMPQTHDTVRFVTYCDITDEDVQAVIRKLKFVDSEYRG